MTKLLNSLPLAEDLGKLLLRVPGVLLTALFGKRQAEGEG